jgi:hypothetical protein
VICGYEVLMIVLSALAQWANHAITVAHPERGYPPTPLWQNVLLDLDYAIAIAAIITLWQMRRSAFFLLASRFGISLIFFIHWKIWPSLPKNPVKLKHPGVVHGIAEAIGLFFLLASAFIAFYAYMLLFHPRPHSMETETASKWPLPPPIR